MDPQNLLRGAPKGDVTVKDDRLQVVYRRRYAKPVAKVWAALTTPERLEDWFGAAKLDLRVGGRLQLSLCERQVDRVRHHADRGTACPGLVMGDRRAGHLGPVRARAGRRGLPAHPDPWRPQPARRPGCGRARGVARDSGRAGGFARRAGDALGRQGTARERRRAALSTVAGLSREGISFAEGEEDRRSSCVSLSQPC